MKWWYVITFFLKFRFSGHPEGVVNMGFISHLALPLQVMPNWEGVTSFE